MMNKKQTKSIVIIRWVALLPVTFLLIVCFGSLLIGSEEHLLSIFKEKTVIKIIDYSILVLMPIIIALSSFFIAPRYKLISVILMVCISLIPYILSFDMDNRIRGLSNFSQLKYINFINPLTITIIFILLIAYKLGKK